MTDFLAGKLLISSLRITEPTFFRTVIFVCAHDEAGALGLVINRPVQDESVAKHLPAFDRFTRAPSCLFSGGPVEGSAALALVRWHEAPVPPETKLIFGNMGLLDLSSPIEEYEAAVREIRLFAGYAGWAAGQLESELREESWFVVDATEEDVFSAEPETLWRDVLRRQPGRLALFAYAPNDPAVN